MKIKITHLTFKLAFIAGIFMAGLSSCEKFNDWGVDEFHDRLFRPSNLTVSVSGVTATLKFVGKPNTNKYEIQLSKDSLQFTSIAKSYLVDIPKTVDGYSYVIPDLLDPLTQYSVRIRGLDSTWVTLPSDWSTVVFKTSSEQLMLPVAIADITTSSVILKWKTPNEVTHFIMNSVRYDISASEKSAGQKTFTGLTPNKAYQASLYLNNNLRGNQSFSTLTDLPTGAGVVNVGPTDDLATLVTNATDGTTFVLLQGTKYGTDILVNIPNGVSLTFYGQPGAIKPIIAFNGFNLPTTAKTIKFENIDLTGYQDSDPTKLKRNYIFNQSAANTTTEIKFENCTIRNFVNSPMRVQGTNTIAIDKFTINNCLVFDCGDNGGAGTYCFINNNVATSKINNISITNSTFYKIGYGLILHNLSTSTSVTIDNNTFNNVIGNGRYFIDYNAQTIGTFSFKNNILGKSLSPLVPPTSKGIRYSGTNIVVLNSFQTSDTALAGNLIPGITDYTQPSTSLFTDPANGNFKIKDDTFSGKSSAGDPRWRL
jgi:hypothetical protein